MRYTRYDYKKKKKGSIGKSIISIMVSIFLVVGIATGLAWIALEIIPVNNSAKLNTNGDDGGNNTENPPPTANVEEEKENSEEDKKEEETEEVVKVVESDINTNFTLIQFGVFASEENAKQLLSSISSEVEGFISEDNELFRVFAGIYTNKEAEDIVVDLEAKEIDSVNVSYTLERENKIQSQVAAILNGYLDILKSTFDDEVKSINTLSFKEWVSELEVISEGENSDTLIEVKKHIENLPEEIERDDISKEMSYLYTVLNRF